jgi:hypothetical protein
LDSRVPHLERTKHTKAHAAATLTPAKEADKHRPGAVLLELR